MTTIKTIPENIIVGVNSAIIYNNPPTSQTNDVYVLKNAQQKTVSSTFANIFFKSPVFTTSETNFVSTLFTDANGNSYYLYTKNVLFQNPNSTSQPNPTSYIGTQYIGMINTNNVTTEYSFSFATPYLILSYPLTACVDNSGLIWVNYCDNNLLVSFNRFTQVTTAYNTPTNPTFPKISVISHDSTRDVIYYITTNITGVNSTIYYFSPSSYSFTLLVTTPFTGIIDFSTYFNNNLYFANNQTSIVYYTISNTTPTITSAYNELPLTFSSSYSLNGICFLNNGNIVLSDSTNNIFVFSSTGGTPIATYLYSGTYFPDNIGSSLLTYNNVTNTIYFSIAYWRNETSNYNVNIVAVGSSPYYYFDNLSLSLGMNDLTLFDETTNTSINTFTVDVISYNYIIGVTTTPSPAVLLAPTTITVPINLYGTTDSFELINNLNNVVSSNYNINQNGEIVFYNVIIPYGGNNLLYLYDKTTANVIGHFGIETSGICFKEGTKILCLTNKKEKYIPIEKIKPNTYVKTLYSFHKCKMVVKSQLINSANRTINKLYCLKQEKDPNLIEDLYVTGGHAILRNNLSPEESSNMQKLAKYYNKYEICGNIAGSELQKFREDNDYKLMLEGKHKLIAFYDDRFEEVDEEDIFNIYHIILENADKYGQYAIYANGVLAESTSEESIGRFPNYERNIPDELATHEDEPIDEPKKKRAICEMMHKQSSKYINGLNAMNKTQKMKRNKRIMHCIS